MFKVALHATLKRYGPILLLGNIALGAVEYTSSGQVDPRVILVRLLVTIAAIGLIGLPLTWIRLKKRVQPPSQN